MIRFLFLMAVLCGCSDTPAPMAPPQDLVDAVLAGEPKAPPPPVEPSPLGMAVESYLDLAAAQSDGVRVDLLTAPWCRYCPAAKTWVKPWLEQKGYTVNVVDIGDSELEKWGVKSLPACLFIKDDVCVASVESVLAKNLKSPYTPSFTDAFAACPPPQKSVAPAVAISVPAISVADLTEGIAGMDQDLFGVVHVTVPKDVSWTVTKKASSVVLTFKDGKQPSLRSLKYVRANPSLLSVEISPFYAEFKTDSWWPMLKTVRVEFDYSPPATKPAKPVAFPVRGRYYPRPQYRPYVPVPQKPRPVVATPEPTPAPPPEPIKLGKSQPAVVQIAHTWKATVCVWLKRDQTVYDIFGVPSIREGKGCGSGMIVSPQGHILTCHHVVDGAKSIEVEFCDGQKRPATVLETDSKVDLVILKVEGVELPAVKFATEPPMVGADAWMVGNPHGRGESAARGIVAGFDRGVDGEDYKHDGLTQVSIAINPGNSGGPVVNSKGECFGVINAMVSDYGGLDAQGIAFCIPFERAVTFVKRVVK